jgi:hypothetical protein
VILSDVLHLLIEDGIEGARHSHASPSRSRLFQGTVDAYEACREREPGELMDLLTRAAVARVDAARRDDEDLEYLSAYEATVESVASVMSCALEYHRLPPITRITTRARIRYAAIVGYERADATKSRSRR